MPLPERERKEAEDALWEPLFARAYRRVLKSIRNPRTPVLGAAGECWCGKGKGHDWPGRTEGAPHPR